MKTGASAWIVCVTGALLLATFAVPAVSAQGAGWDTAELLETSDAGDANYPQVAVDPSGNAMAVWSQSDGVRDSIWSNRYVAGVGWGTAVLVETNDAGDALDPQIAVDSDGDAVAVWEEYESGRGDVWANRYVVGSGWGTAGLLETDDTAAAWGSQVAVDPGGNAIAVWTQLDGASFSVWADRYVVGAGWGTPELIEAGGSVSVAAPQVAVSAAGDAVAVWEQLGGTGWGVWSNRYVVGTGWGTAGPIETDGTGSAGVPQVASDPSGNAIAVWVQYDGAFYSIYANRYVVGTGWGAAQLIETDDTGNAGLPQVASDPGGDAVAVWELYDGAFYSIYANRYVVGTGWGTRELVETNDTADAFGPQIAVDSDGDAMAVWEQYKSGLGDVWANRYAVGTGWGTATLIETNDTADAWDPQVGVDPAGDAVVVWQQFDGTRTNIWANRYAIVTGNPLDVTLVIAAIVLVPVLAIVAALVYILVKRRKRGGGPTQ